MNNSEFGSERTRQFGGIVESDPGSRGKIVRINDAADRRGLGHMDLFRRVQPGDSQDRDRRLTQQLLGGRTQEEPLQSPPPVRTHYYQIDRLLADDRKQLVPYIACLHDG